VPVYLSRHGAYTLDLALKRMIAEIGTQPLEKARTYKIRMPLDPDCEVSGTVGGRNGYTEAEASPEIVVTSRHREPNQRDFHTRSEVEAETVELINAVRKLAGVRLLSKEE